MLCRRVSLEELHPALGGGAPETGLDIYCRGRTGLLADDGARWAVLILPGGGYERIAPAEFDIMYGEGISKIGEILDLGAKLDLVQKSGSWFAMGETRLGQGRDAAKQYLKDNPEVCDKLEADIRRNAYKLMSSQARAAAKAAGRAVDISAEDFEDADS